jgi:hypothetical protein
MYVAIAVVSLLFALTVVLSVTDYVDRSRNYLNKRQQQKAEEFRHKADSIARVVEITQDSLLHEIKEDSINYMHEKESLKSVYIKKVKKYESRLADIDTLNDLQLNSGFSIREMLSDSSSKLW